MPTHHMVTRTKAGIFKSLERMNCHVTTTSPLSLSLFHVHALHDPNWKEAMLDEYNALITNETWVFVPRPVNVNVVRSMWLFKHKFNADGTLSKYKARLRIIASLHREFPMTDIGSLNYFLGISAQRSTSGLFLSQSKFTEKILERAHMQNYNPCRTPIDTESKLGLDGDPVNDPTLYHSLAGALQYLTFTRPDLSYVVQQVCLYMHDPRDPHFTALKRILRYVHGTFDYGLQLYVSSTTQLSAYTDSDWAGCPVTRRFTSGYCVFLGDNLLLWSAKRQITLSRSSAEAEYRGVANVVAETAWIRNFLCELHTPLFAATLVYCDNVSVVYMSANPVQHQRTKHIEIDIHFVRDFVASGQVRVLHVPSRFLKDNIWALFDRIPKLGLESGGLKIIERDEDVYALYDLAECHNRLDDECFDHYPSLHDDEVGEDNLVHRSCDLENVGDNVVIDKVAGNMAVDNVVDMVGHNQEVDSVCDMNDATKGVNIDEEVCGKLEGGNDWLINFKKAIEANVGEQSPNAVGLNGNGPVFVTTDTNRMIKVLPPKITKEVMARERERKAKTTLLMALPEDHLAKFHKMVDEKKMWEAIKSRFGGNDESKKMQKYLLKQQFELFYMSTSEGLHKGYDSVSSPSVSKSKKEGSSSYTDEVIHSFFANQSSALQLDYYDLEQINDDDMEEMDLKWHMAMISMRIKKFYKRTRRKLRFDTKDLIGFDITKVECFNCHKMGHFARDCRAKGNQDRRKRDVGYNGNKTRDNGRRPAYQDDSKALVTIDGEDINWSGYVEKDAQNYAMMAYSSSNSGSDNEVKSCFKTCEESYARHKKLYDEQRDKLGDASVEITAYTLALKKIEAQLLCHQQNQLAYEQNIRFLKIDLDDKTDVLVYHKKLLAEAIKEKEDLKTKFKNWQNSSKNLNRLLNTKMSANDKFRLGYGDYRYGSILSYENEVLHNVFMNKASDLEDTYVNDRYAEGMHATSVDESDSKPSEYASCESDSSVETTSIPKLVKNAPKVVCKPKVWTDTLIIEKYESDSDNDLVSNVQEDKEKPSFAFTHSVKHVKTSRENVKETSTPNHSPKIKKHDRNSHTKKGLGYAFTRKACFVCGNKSHLADYQEFKGGSVAFGGPKKAKNSAGTQANDDQGANSEEIDLYDKHFVLPIWSAYSTNVKSSGDKIEKNTDFKTCEKPVSQVEQIFLEELEKLKRQEKEANDADELLRKEATHDIHNAHTSSTSILNTVSIPLSTAGPSRAFNDSELSYLYDPSMPHLENIYASPIEGIFIDLSYDDEGVITNFNNLETTVNVSPTPIIRIHTIHPKTQILRDPMSAVQTRSKVNKNSKAHAFHWKMKVGLMLCKRNCCSSKFRRQEEGIDYDKVFAPVARIEAIRIFLAFASYMGFIVYQMDVKSAFLYDTIDKEVYVTQPPSFVDLKFPNKVYKVVKALYGLHQALKAWYATLSTFLEKIGYRRGAIYKTLFIKQDKKDIMLVQVYVDDIIFGSTKKSWCDEFVELMKNSVKTARILIETQKPLVKDKEAADVDVTPKTSHLQAVKRIFRYLKGQPKLGLWYLKVSSFDLEAYSDSDYAGANLDSKELASPKQTTLEEVIRQDLCSDDADGVECLSNEEIYAELARMGYEKPPPKLTFYKAFFSAQWKFLIHTLIQCVSAKRTTWNEFSCSMASVVICLATADLTSYNTTYTSPALTQKDVEEKEEEDEIPTAPTPPSPTSAPSPPPQDHIPTPPQAQPATPSTPTQEQPTKTFESSIPLMNTLLETYATLSQKVAELEQDKHTQALEIIKLKNRVKKLEKKRTSKSSGLKRLRKIEGKIEAIDADKDITLVDVETQVDMDAELHGRIDQDTLIMMKAEKVKLFGEQIAQRLHDEEIEKAAAREKQEKDDLERAKVLKQQYDDKQENIDWNTIAEQIQEKHLNNIRKYQSLKRKPISIAQAKKNMIIYLKNMVGYKMKHFRGRTYDKKRVAEETLLQESFKKLKAVEVLEKDYPLSNVVMIMMLSAKLQVKEDSEMARDIVMKIFMEANKPKSRSLDTSSKLMPLGKVDTAAEVTEEITLSKNKQEKAAKQSMPKYSIKLFDEDSLKEYILKDRLIKLTIKSKSYNTHPAHIKLYDALMDLLLVDEDDMDKQLDDQPSQMERHHDDQDPPTDVVKEFKKRKKKDSDETSSKKSKDKDASSKDYKAPSKSSNYDKVVDAEETIQDDAMDAKKVNEVVFVDTQDDDAPTQD
uniref:Ribonuclease H-like domain-containing protein n=1 Tax=Tanacetum cinerariifolium TaxID=118510 RepID=A0A6L2JBH9_TANCI|nr:ribonuclease H-like domain-containing protein [Tanacetum cinerariifolium]